MRNFKIPKRSIFSRNVLSFSSTVVFFLSLPSFAGWFIAEAQVEQVVGTVAKEKVKTEAVKLGEKKLHDIGQTIIKKHNLSAEEASVLNKVLDTHSPAILGGVVSDEQLKEWFLEELVEQGLSGSIEETALPQIIAQLNVLQKMQNSTAGEYINRFASVLSNLENMGSRIESLDGAFQATVTASSLFDGTNILQELYSSYQTMRSALNQAGSLIEGADDFESFNDAYYYATRVVSINNSLFNEFERLVSILSKKNVSNDRKLAEVKEMNQVIKDLQNELGAAKAEIVLKQYNNIVGVTPIMNSLAEMRFGQNSSNSSSSGVSASSLPGVSMEAVRIKEAEDRTAEDVDSTRQTLIGFFEPMLNIASIIAAIIFAILAIFAYYRSNDIEKQHHNAFYKLITGGLITVALLQVIRIVFSSIFSPILMSMS